MYTQKSSVGQKMGGPCFLKKDAFEKIVWKNISFITEFVLLHMTTYRKEGL